MLQKYVISDKSETEIIQNCLKSLYCLQTDYLPYTDITNRSKSWHEAHKADFRIAHTVPQALWF
jgi:hypothetical protein